MARKYFTPKTFAFLRDLEANNDRTWFKARKDVYDSVIKEPALDFIEDFAPYLERISKHFLADPSPVGGSLFRIHRDTRFGKDKTPYKTNTGMQFRHFLAKDAHAPGFYLHIEPGGCFAGIGLWRPEPAVANQIRQMIADNPVRWKRVAYGKPLSNYWSQEGDKLKRPPKGFDPDHPLIEDLKRKDFLATTNLTQRQVTAPGFLEEWARMCKAGSGYVRFLCEAVGVPF